MREFESHVKKKIHIELQKIKLVEKNKNKKNCPRTWALCSGGAQVDIKSCTAGPCWAFFAWI